MASPMPSDPSSRPPGTPRRKAALIFGYMAFIYAVVCLCIHYAADHPLVP